MKRYYIRILAVLLMLCVISTLTACHANKGVAPESPSYPSGDVTFEAESEELPNIVVLATGGTIAGTAADDSQTVGYDAATVFVESLLDSVEGLGEIANITGEQFVQIASQDMTSDIWLALGKRVNELLSDDNVDGVVITHGTDTMEDTAYFLNLTVKSDKPVVLTGAMRPSTSMSADGPINLYNAVTVAGDEASVGKGVTISMNNEVYAARDVRKGNAFQVDTFTAGTLGSMGFVQDGSVQYFYESTKCHTSESPFDISQLTQLPRVEILYGYAGADSEMLQSAINSKPDGIVMACVGNGSVSKDFCEILKTLDGKLPFVRSSRTMDGYVARNGEVNDDEYKTLAANSLSPQKAHILLMLALTQTTDLNEIQVMMDTY